MHNIDVFGPDARNHDEPISGHGNELRSLGGTYQGSLRVRDTESSRNVFARRCRL